MLASNEKYYVVNHFDVNVANGFARKWPWYVKIAVLVVRRQLPSGSGISLTTAQINIYQVQRIQKGRTNLRHWLEHPGSAQKQPSKYLRRLHVRQGHVSGIACSDILSSSTAALATS